MIEWHARAIFVAFGLALGSASMACGPDQIAQARVSDERDQSLIATTRLVERCPRSFAVARNATMLAVEWEANEAGARFARQAIDRAESPYQRAQAEALRSGLLSRLGGFCEARRTLDAARRSVARSGHGDALLPLLDWAERSFQVARDEQLMAGDEIACLADYVAKNEDAQICLGQCKSIGLRVTLSVNFPFDSANPDERGKSQVLELAKAIASSDFPERERYTIAGHTDQIGSAQYNKLLSTKRARAVIEILERSIPEFSGRFVAEGYGEEMPLEDHSTCADPAAPECDANRFNRRVEIEL